MNNQMTSLHFGMRLLYFSLAFSYSNYVSSLAFLCDHAVMHFIRYLNLFDPPRCFRGVLVHIFDGGTKTKKNQQTTPLILVFSLQMQANIHILLEALDRSWTVSKKDSSLTSEILRLILIFVENLETEVVDREIGRKQNSQAEPQWTADSLETGFVTKLWKSESGLRIHFWTVHPFS